MLSRIPRFVVLASLVFTCAAMFAWTPPIHADSGTKTVKYGETDVIPIHAKIRFSTLIVLPVNEEILDATTAIKSFGSSTALTISAISIRPSKGFAAI